MQLKVITFFLAPDIQALSPTNPGGGRPCTAPRKFPPLTARVNREVLAVDESTVQRPQFVTLFRGKFPQMCCSLGSNFGSWFYTASAQPLHRSPKGTKSSLLNTQHMEIWKDNLTINCSPWVNSDIKYFLELLSKIMPTLTKSINRELICK